MATISSGVSSDRQLGLPDASFAYQSTKMAYFLFSGALISATPIHKAVRFYCLEAPALDPALDEALQAFMAERKEGLADSVA